MSKRFTTTEKWSDPWFRKLEPRLKLMWDWMFTNCDIAGTIDIDFELASFQIGSEVGEDDIACFGDRILRLDSGRFYLTKFIDFQYGELTKECRAHRAVLNLIDTLSIPYQYPIQRYKDKDKDKDKDNSLGKSAEKTLSDGTGTEAFGTSKNHLDPEWSDYLEMRKKVRKPATARAQELALKELEKLAPSDIGKQKAILNQSIMNSWQGLFQLKDKFEFTTTQTQKHPMYREFED